MVKVAHTYTIRESALTNEAGQKFWDMHKVDEDFNAESSYRIIEIPKNGVIEYYCSCPAYKSLCKHIHWLKALKLKINRDATIIGGVFNPAKNDWDRIDHK